MPFSSMTSRVGFWEPRKSAPSLAEKASQSCTAPAAIDESPGFRLQRGSEGDAEANHEKPGVVTTKPLPSELKSVGWQ